RAIATNKSGTMYFAATNGLLEYDGSSWNLRPYNTGFGPKLMDLMATKGGEIDVQSLMVEDNGTVWLAVRNGGVYNVRNNYARYFDAYNSPLPGNSVMKMLKDNAGNKWMLTGQQHPTWHRTYYERNHPMYSSDNNGVAALK